MQWMMNIANLLVFQTETLGMHRSCQLLAEDEYMLHYVQSYVFDKLDIGAHSC